ncbi:MAG: protein TolQ [Cardiobacteriaceae bacterium]|nr:protein TolQ [Cardiobacteriaceae bacterium]
MEPNAPSANGMSVVHLVSNASLPVKIIMLILFLMFLTTLFITGKKYVQFLRLRYKIRQFDKTFWSGSDLEVLYASYNERQPESIERVFTDGFREFMQFNGNNLENPDAIVHNCRRAMTAALNRESSQQEQGLNLLATIGSSAPYIGLLGTIYGIMNSFIAIGGAQNTSISSVAPGIAEALIATAMGLLAAIPSVLSYNYYVARSETLTIEYDAFIEEFSNLLQRQILLARDYQRRQQRKTT